MMRTPIMTAVVGVVLGFSLHHIGFTDYSEVQKMFTLADLRLVLVFGLGVTLTAAAFRAMGRKLVVARRDVHPGTVVGGVLFGLGWALTGACPGVVFAQLGEGKVYALWSLAGVVIGTAIYPRVHRRFFRWGRNQCA